MIPTFHQSIFATTDSLKDPLEKPPGIVGLLKTHLILGEVSSSPGETSHPALALFRTQLGKVKSQIIPWEKHKLGSQVAKCVYAVLGISCGTPFTKLV